MCADSSTFLALTGPTEFISVGPVSTGSVTWLSTGTAGDTITIGSATLTAVTGARAAGSLTWSVDGDETAEATSFLAALQDSALTSVVSATRSGTTVNMTTLATGAASEIALSSSNALVYDLSGSTFTGGSALLDFTLTTTCSMLAPLCWGSKKTAGHVYLTAHFLALQMGQESGAVSSKTIDRISIGYAATSFNTSDAAFSSTKWGRAYLALKSTIPSIGAVSSNGGIIGVIG
jgi:hypothetical protein